MTCCCPRCERTGSVKEVEVQIVNAMSTRTLNDSARLQDHGTPWQLAGQTSHPRLLGSVRKQRGTGATKLRSPLIKRRGRKGFRKGRKENLPPRSSAPTSAPLSVRILARREDFGARNLFRFNAGVFGSVKAFSCPTCGRAPKRNKFRAPLLLRLCRATSSALKISAGLIESRG
jgi:hypothetical protein